MTKEFYQKNAYDVAINLVGKILVRLFLDGRIIKTRITETECYIGENDDACHAHKGRTKRTEVMYHEGGTIYVYLIYGMYYLLNIVTGSIDEPQGVLIRATADYDGPGKITKNLEIDKSFYGKNILSCNNLWIEEDDLEFDIKCDKRVNIDYASEEYKNKLWRFILVSKK